MELYVFLFIVGALVVGIILGWNARGKSYIPLDADQAFEAILKDLLSATQKELDSLPSYDEEERAEVMGRCTKMLARLQSSYEVWKPKEVFVRKFDNILKKNQWLLTYRLPSNAASTESHA